MEQYLLEASAIVFLLCVYMTLKHDNEKYGQKSKQSSSKKSRA